MNTTTTPASRESQASELQSIHISEHTPGPWHIETHPDDPTGWGSIEIQRSDAIVIAVTTLDGNFLADAYLIAAAPDLLTAGEKMVAALEGLLSLYGYGDVGDAYLLLEVAIAKAKGGGQ